MQRVIELIRVSTEAQAGADRASIPAQRAVNRRTCAAYNLEIIRTIEITDVSGAAVLLAPEIQELLRLMAAPEVHGVVAREFSRLMRPENFSDYALLQAFADTRTILYLPEGAIDFASKTGRLMGTIRAAIAGAERTEILDRIWQAKEEKRRAGKFAQSPVCLPFGVGYTEAQGWHYTPDAERVRAAFELFLSGEVSYFSVGRKVGIEPFNLRIILRNPIYTGWRVIDKKRDTSAAARRTKRGGRQGDRPKIQRAPDDVIRVQVISEPLISAGDFARVQELMNVKRSRHWRTRDDYEHRFTYNGFLTCATCNEVVHTGKRRDDYYICSGRRILRTCKTPYMRRDILDPQLDRLFAARLTDDEFLQKLVAEFKQTAGGNESARRAAHLESELARLDAKRQRILDAYFEGVITAEERAARLGKIEAAATASRGWLKSHRPAASLTADALAVFSAFFEYEFLNRDDKRKLLASLISEIKIADYRVAGLSISTGVTDVNHTGMGSSPPRA